MSIVTRTEVLTIHLSYSCPGEWKMGSVDEPGAAYEWARKLADHVGGNEYTVRPPLPEFWGACNELASSADLEQVELEVWSARYALVLGQPFVPKLLGTITVRRSDS